MTPTHLAQITERYCLNRPGSSRETWHIVLEVQHTPFPFRPGDSVGIWPKNPEQTVQGLLSYFHIDQDFAIFCPHTKEDVPAYTWLHEQVDLGIITPKLLRLISHHAREVTERKKVEELLLAGQQLFNLLDVLKHHVPGGVALPDIAEGLLPIRPRLYSIASGPSLSPSQFDLTVARVHYQQNGQTRLGLCSNYLTHEAPLNKAEVQLFLQPTAHFLLPLPAERPVIMVGPGTGIAPFRSYIQEIDHRGGPWPRCWLFFGERNRSTDFLYEDFWQRHAETKKLRFDVAFSQDQEHKIYVQHKMWEARSDLWHWFNEGAQFFVCGNAKQMAKDIDQCLLDIAASEGNLSREEALAWIKQLRHSHRYLRDIYA